MMVVTFYEIRDRLRLFSSGRGQLRVFGASQSIVTIPMVLLSLDQSSTFRLKGADGAEFSYELDYYLDEGVLQPTPDFCTCQP